MSEQKMRQALEWLADEMRSELTDDGASLPQWLVKSWLARCTGALAEQPAQGEVVPFKQRFIDAVNDRNQLRVQLVAATAKAVLWDTLNAALMSRSGIALNNERDCYEAARQWAEAHDDASSYKAAAQKLREERDTIAALKVEAVTLTAPPAPAVPDGWKLVPIRPTDEMTKAVRYDEDAFGVKSAWPSDVWRDMLAAAPEVPRG